MPPQRMTYVQIADDLAHRIELGEYPVDSKLPTYVQLAAMYAPSSIATVQRAVMLLRREGVVKGIPGVGVYVVGRSRQSDDQSD